MADGPHEFHDHIWDRLASNTPITVAQSTTVHYQVSVSPRARMLLVAYQNAANISARSIVGVGTGLTYLAAGAAPAGGFDICAIAPGLDSAYQINVTCGASGLALVYIDQLDADSPWMAITPGQTAGGLASSVEILDAAGIFKLAIDAAGRIGINNFPTTYALEAGGNLAALVAQKYTAHHVASQLTIALGVAALAARATRTSYTLAAPATNAAPILITSIFPIAAGGVYEGKSIDAVAFTGTNGDVLNVVEEYN